MATPADPPKEPITAQPKISQRLILRTAILLFAIAIMFFGFRYFQEMHGDFDRGSSNSSGDIAAIQIKDNGQETVLIHPDGTITGTKNWIDGVSDRDIVWQPDGRFVYFVSDRDGGTYRLVRLNPDSDSTAPMTAGSRGRSVPSFPADNPPDANSGLLMISGGTIQGFDPKGKLTPQLLPPATTSITHASDEGTEAGAEAEFEAMYGGLGTAFKYARYCKSNRFIAAVMEREGGEVLILQDLTPKDGKLPNPTPVVAGEQVDFDVSPKDGSVVFAVRNFSFLDPKIVPKAYIKNGKIVVPFRHMMGFVDPDQRALQLIGASPDDRAAFSKPAVSPDGSTVLFSAGSYDKTTQSITPKALISCPVAVRGFQTMSHLVDGEVYEPSWSPDGSKIVYAMRISGKREIFTAGKDGSSPTDVTAGKGDFLTPLFSPQIKAGG
jgi:dipeptidyl aminopeptidase/acylaminoacyl peptidase